MITRAFLSRMLICGQDKEVEEFSYVPYSVNTLKIANDTQNSV